MKQQIMFFNRQGIGIKEFDLGVLNSNIMQLRNCVQIAEVEKYLSWLKGENANGGDIYVRPHRHNLNSVIFLDDVEKGMALSIAKKYSACVIETSKEGGCHVWLQTDKALNERERYLAQRYLQPLINSDKGSISGEHFGRLAGFKNQKRGGEWVNVIAVSDAGAWCVPSEVLIDDKLKGSTPLLSPPMGGGVVDNKSNNGSSESENEWGYVCGKLEHGADPILLESELANRAQNRGKRNATKYAKLTIAKALVATRDTRQ